MQACAVEAPVEIKIMAGDQLLSLIPKVTELETAIQPFCVRGVSLDHVRHGHIDFAPVCSTRNMLQRDTSQQSPARATLSRTTQRRPRGASARGIE